MTSGASASVDAVSSGSASMVFTIGVTPAAARSEKVIVEGCLIGSPASRDDAYFGSEPDQVGAQSPIDNGLENGRLICIEPPQIG